MPLAAYSRFGSARDQSSIDQILTLGFDTNTKETILGFVDTYPLTTHVLVSIPGTKCRC